MPARLSRRKIAEYIATELTSGAKASRVFSQVAAYLVETGRTRETELLVRDIEEALGVRGIVIANVTSAHSLTDAIKAEIKKLIGAKEVYFCETVDPQVLGGVRIDVPGKRFDGTLLHKLNALRAKQL